MVKKIVLVLCFMGSLEAFSFRSLFSRKPKLIDVDASTEINMIIETFNDIYPDHSAAYNYYILAHRLKAVGDRKKEVRDRLKFYRKAEDYAYVCAAIYLSSRELNWNQLQNTQKVLELTQRIDKWRLDTFGIQNYYLSGESLELWPRFRERYASLTAH